LVKEHSSEGKYLVGVIWLKEIESYEKGMGKT